MNSNIFNLRVVIHAVLIAVTAAVFMWTLNKDYLVFTRISLAALWIAQIILLIAYVNRTNKDLLIFLQSFEYKDDTLTFNRKKKLPFKGLYSEFNRIVDDFRQVKIDREVEHQYFQNSIKHVNTGLIAFDASGKVELYNDAAKRLLNIEYLPEIHLLEKLQPNLPEALIALKPGGQKLVKTVHDNEVFSLSFRAAEFKLQDRFVKLISLQNIKSELEAQELASWQKLIRVLTHEIINSVSPIAILSSTLIKMFEMDGKAKTIDQIDNTQLENTLSAVQAINKRSQGLSRFVESYKSLTKLPEPEPEEVSLVEMINRLKTLMKRESTEKEVKLITAVKPVNLKVLADEKLLEQVLINILKNAYEALEQVEVPQIEISAERRGDGVLIEVTDNGSGMSKEVLENIFVPFYTTKKEGTGIGLSLSRQIIRKHNGTLEVYSTPGAGTSFRIKL